VRIYNSQEKKLDLRTIIRYFIGYAKKSKGYRFYCPSHNTRINANFLKNDLISGSDQFLDIAFEKGHYEAQPSGSSEKIVVIHAPQVQAGVRQPIIDVPQFAEYDHVDQTIDEEQVPQQYDEATLRR